MRIQGLLAACVLALALATCGSARNRPAETAGAPASWPAGATLALTHATVIDPADGSRQPDRTVVIGGDRILAVVAGVPPGAAPARTLDMSGKYLIPGLWDMHVHFADPNAARLFVANGVTGVRVMWGNPRFAPGMERVHFDLRDAFDKQTQIGPRMVIASQILDGPRPIWPNSVALSTPEQGRRAVIDARTGGADFIKVYSLLPRAVYLAIADESKKQGIPFAGHVPREVSMAEASDLRQKSVEHLGGIALACSSREETLRERSNRLAPIGSSAERRAIAEEVRASYDPARAQALFAKLRANGTWQCPTLTVLHNMAHFDDPSRASDPRMAYVPPFVRQMWDPRNDFRTRQRRPEDYAAMRADLPRQLELLGNLARAGVPLLAGTDELNPYCFPGFSLHDELGLFVKAGLTPLEALRTATSSPARFLGRADLGGVAAGKVADLVALDADPLLDIGNTRKIHTVVLRGAAHDRAALDRMLAEVKAAAGGTAQLSPRRDSK